MAFQATMPSQIGVGALGPNWQLQFVDADGIPLNMGSFEILDFGAISYKEIFQNVKTIMATPLLSAALERTLGVDATIVDRPMNDASRVTVAILDAINYWEPRVQIMNIAFSADAINGHLVVNLQLNIQNVIFGTTTTYAALNIFATPTNVVQGLPPIVPAPGPTGVAGPQGPQGQRGSLWFTGTAAPPTGAMIPMSVPTKGRQGPAGAAGERGFVWLQGAGDPVTPQNLDMYLNTTNGDVWQFDGSTQTWRRTRKQ